MDKYPEPKTEKKICMHGPDGQGTADGRYYFSLYDVNGELVTESKAFDDLGSMLDVIHKSFKGFRLDVTDLGNEAPKRIQAHA